jgi:MFS family permease
MRAPFVFANDARSYDIFSISIVATMLGYVYHNKSPSLGVNEDLGIKVATPIGNLVGQLLFGWLADVLGRKKMCTCCVASETAVWWLRLSVQTELSL